MSPARPTACLCADCGRRLRAATEARASAQPMEGLLSICWYCGALAIFEADYTLRAPTAAELVTLEADPFIETIRVAVVGGRRRYGSGLLS